MRRCARPVLMANPGTREFAGGRNVVERSERYASAAKPEESRDSKRRARTVLVRCWSFPGLIKYCLSHGWRRQFHLFPIFLNSLIMLSIFLYFAVSSLITLSNPQNKSFSFSIGSRLSDRTFGLSKKLAEYTYPVAS
jgi:hypothetical protein